MASQFDNSGRTGFGKFDSVRACDAEYVIRVGPGGGVRGAIERAERATGTTPRTFVAVARDGKADLSIEATYAPRSEQLVLDALTVRTRVPVKSCDRGLALAEEALDRFGGNGYVAFGASRGAPLDGFETTICFPDVIPWVAQNTLVVPRLFAMGDVALYGELLSMISVKHTVRGRNLDVQRHQLRLRPSLRALSAAFASSVHEGFRTTLYAAALPVTRSVRIEQFSHKNQTWLEIAITKGLSRRSCTVSDMLDMDAFLRSSLGLCTVPLSWRVRAAGVIAPKAKRDAQAPAAPAPPRASTRSAPRLRPALRVIEGGRSARA